MNPTFQQSLPLSRLGRLALGCALACSFTSSHAQTVPPAAAAAKKVPSSSPVSATPAPPAQTTAPVGPAKSAAKPDARSNKSRQAQVPEATVLTPLSAAAKSEAAVALADLGLAMMRLPPLVGEGGTNTVMSPVSVASAMALVHAGAAGATRREIGLLLSSAEAPDRGMTIQFPAILRALAPVDPNTSPLVMANRVWVDKAIEDKVGSDYRQAAKAQLGGDVAGVNFETPGPAAATINGWVSGITKGLIPTLVSEAALRPGTRAVVTNAVYFKSAWDKPFDAASTRPSPFGTGPAGADRKSVPTMVGERQVAAGEFSGTEVYELPFRNREFVLLMAMPAKGQTLQTLLNGATGLVIASWRAGLAPKQCLFQMPRFNIRLPSTSLQQPLKLLGVNTAFEDRADFTPMLGTAAQNVRLTDVLHAASIVVDETGGEAAAATAAITAARSAAIAPDVCAIDRPFLYVLLHRESGAPLFIGRVVDPAAN